MMERQQSKIRKGSVHEWNANSARMENVQYTNRKLTVQNSKR
jgi:hypothetical protein